MVRVYCTRMTEVNWVNKSLAKFTDPDNPRNCSNSAERKKINRRAKMSTFTVADIMLQVT